MAATKTGMLASYPTEYMSVEETTRAVKERTASTANSTDGKEKLLQFKLRSRELNLATVKRCVTKRNE